MPANSLGSAGASALAAGSALAGSAGASAGLLAAGGALGAAGFTSGTLPSTVISLRGHFWAQMPQPMHFS